MSDKKKSENDAALKQLASNIQEGHRRVMSNTRDSIQQARIIGQQLADARDRVRHGRWQAWVEANCDFSPRMALKYMLVARHFDALIALFNTQDEWTLTEFFSVAGEMKAKAKQARAGKQGIGKVVKMVPADAFRLEKAERRKKLKQVEKIKLNGQLEVERSEPFKNFLKDQSERLLKAIRKFTGSKDIKEFAGDLDPVHLGVLLLDSLKSQLKKEDLFDLPAKVETTDATDASKPPETASRLGHHDTNGHARGKKAVA